MLPLTFSLAVAAGCGAPDGEPLDRAVQEAGFVSYDAHGSRRVESFEPVWGNHPAWTVEEEPILRIGVVAGDPVYQFTLVRDAARLADGGVVVADGPGPWVRFYDADGRHRVSVGGRGEGPGEFQRQAGYLCIRADGTLAVDDWWTQRYHLLTADGEVIETRSTERSLVLGEFGCFGNGGWLVAEWSQSQERGDLPLMRSWWQYYQLGPGPDGGLDGPLLRHPGRSSWRIPGFQHMIHLTGTSSVSVQGDHLVVWDEEAHTIEVRAADGTVRTVIRPVAPVRIADIWDRWASRAPTPWPERDRAWEEMTARGPTGLFLPKYVSTYQRVRLDPLGFIWAERRPWRALLPEFGPGHDIFDLDGRWLGTVETPSHLGWLLLEIGEDYLLARHSDTLGVHSVGLHRLLGRDGG